MKHTQGQWTRYAESRNLQTRKHPRTLQEAFGPYCSNEIEEPGYQPDWQDAVVVWACVITIVLVSIFKLW